jgi:hypothetical protein
MARRIRGHIHWRQQGTKEKRYACLQASPKEAAIIADKRWGSSADSRKLEDEGKEEQEENRFYIYICGLLNDAASSSDCIASTVRIINGK